MCVCVVHTLQVQDSSFTATLCIKLLLLVLFVGIVCVYVLCFFRRGWAGMGSHSTVLSYY